MADSLKRLISRRHSVLQKALALAPVLLLLVYVPGQMMLRCRVDGLLRPTCCCSHPSADDDRDQPSLAIKGQDCCEQQMTGGERPVVDAARRTSPDVSLAVAIAAPVLTLSDDLATPDRLARSWQAQGPPRHGPPLVLLKHAFLI